MTSLDGLPAEPQVRQAFTRLVDQAHHNGLRPSVLSLARQFGLTNTTFRRHYPEIVRELGQIRRTPAAALTESSAATEHLELAVANIARLTLDNHHMRTELERARHITNIKSRSASE